MKYNQPYGMPAETTLYSVPYINGDPTVGQQGSIPPAASIEHDQREIVAVIQWAKDNNYLDQNGTPCASPTSADLTQLLKAIFGIINSTRLTAPKTYYVNDLTGNDSNDGKTSGTAFKTLQRAANEATKFNLNGFTITINVAAPVSSYAPVICPTLNGSGIVQFIGNTTTPANCSIAASNGPAVLVEGFGYQFHGFKFSSASNDAARALPSCGVRVHPLGGVTLGTNNEFGFCLSGAGGGGHMDCHGGVLAFTGAVRISGSANYHVHSHDRGYIYATGSPLPTFTITAGGLNFTAWAYATGTSMINLAYSGTSGSIATGQKAVAETNGVIGTNGAGTGSWPGVGTSTTTGGQIL